jgi:hypothetical protein
LLAVAGVAVAGLIVASIGLASASAPSGQVMVGNTSFDSSTGHFVGGGGTIEPTYDYSTGLLTYIRTPNNAAVHPPVNPKMRMVNGLPFPVNVAPIYLPVYPKSFLQSDPSVTLNCFHLPADNCADHGNAVAGAAESLGNPTVYGAGVAGHDHLIGVASTGGDFNVIWEPVLVLFNNTAAVHHITTLSDLLSEINSSNVTQIGLPQLDFHCSVVSAAAYNNGIPGPNLPPDPNP